MENQTSGSLTLTDKKRFILSRINGDDIEITNAQRMEVLKLLSGGVRFIQLGEITLMANSIRSIEPIHEEHVRFDYFDDNFGKFLPPRPQDMTADERKQARQNIAQLKEVFKTKGGDNS